MGTYGTIHSQVYQRLIKQKFPSTNIHGKSCPLLVPLIEEGMHDHPILEQSLKGYLRNPDLDILILGCTHYPLIKKSIANFCKKETVILDSSQACSLQAHHYLKEHNLLNRSKIKGSSSFYVSDDPCKFKKIATFFMKSKIDSVKKAIL